MNLHPIKDSEIALVASWLAEKQNYEWLDFGNGVQVPTPVMLKFMIQKENHLLRVFTLDQMDEPLGVVAFSNVARNFRTALLWYVLGNKAFACQGHTTRAVSELLRIGFTELSLRAVEAWAVDENRASIRVLEKNAFRHIGRQRSCHDIDGRAMDRLLFDLLSSEYVRLEAA